jgi:hypothetical protein
MAMEATMKAIHPIKAGITLAALIGGGHLCWAVLVAVGWAQPVMDFIFWIHFIKPVYVVGPFDLGTAAILVAITTVVGFVVAYVFSVLWNRLHLN